LNVFQEGSFCCRSDIRPEPGGAQNVGHGLPPRVGFARDGFVDVVAGGGKGQVCFVSPKAPLKSCSPFSGQSRGQPPSSVQAGLNASLPEAAQEHAQSGDHVPHHVFISY